MKQMLYIYNPMSGNQPLSTGTDKAVDSFQRRGILLMPYRLTGRREADDATIRALIRRDSDGVIVNGGDGTINQVVSLLRQDGISLPLGMIPSGTCNDFARSLDIQGSLDACAATVAADRRLKVDLGLISNAGIFINTCAAGQFVDVSFSTHSDLKRNFGPLAYYIKAIGEMAVIRSFHIRMNTAEGEVLDEEVILFIIMNGRHAAGFHNVIRNADMTDGCVDILLLKQCTHIDLASIFFRLVVNDYIEDRHIRLVRTAGCDIQSDREVNTTVDGEKGPPLPYQIHCERQGLEVWVPETP